MEKTALTKTQIISELAKSTHGKLEEYVTIGTQAAKLDADFFQHLIAWNQYKGQIRDSKVALPVIGLMNTDDEEYISNDLAHIAIQNPRELLKAYRFALGLKPQGKMRLFRRLISAYLRKLEGNSAKWERTAVQHRNVLKELYALSHTKPNIISDMVLFKGEYPNGTVFQDILRLKDMSPLEAAATIIDRRIPFLIAQGALGSKVKNTDLLMALIERMTPTELVTNTAWLEKNGMQQNPALRAAFQDALKKASKSKANVLKTSTAVEAVEDEEIKAQLKNLQEKQIQNTGGIEGNWLVLGDKSGSMTRCINVSVHVAATLAKFVKGQVHLIFFDNMPYHYDVTGKSMDEIIQMTKRISAGGGTQIGCGVEYAQMRGFDIDGIAVVSDGEDARTDFIPKYNNYVKKFDKEPSIYFYRVQGGGHNSFTDQLKVAKMDFHQFDIPTNVDYYSLPNLVQTMRVGRFHLLDEIMNSRLLKIEDIIADFQSAKKGVTVGA